MDELFFLDRLLKPQMVFADIGANQGEFTVYAAKRLHAGKVLAFEPIDSSYERLIQNVGLNNFRNVLAYKLALSDKARHVEMFTSLDRELHHSFHEGLATMFPSSYRSTKVGVVRTEVFDKVFAEAELGRLDVMKVDVEGAELPALRGAYITLEKYKPVILMEVNEETFNAAGYTTNDVVDFLEHLNYTIFLLGNGKVIQVKRQELPNFANIVCQ